MHKYIEVGNTHTLIDNKNTVLIIKNYIWRI